MRSKMCFILLAFALSATASAQQYPGKKPPSADAFGELRAIAMPLLSCERSFDLQRRKLLDEERVINALPIRTATDGDQEWLKAREVFQAKYQEFLGQKAAQCRAAVYFDRFEKRLSQMQPKLEPYDVRSFASHLFMSIQTNDELAADFRSGYNLKRFTPPSALPPAKNDNAPNQ